MNSQLKNDSQKKYDFYQLWFIIDSEISKNTFFQITVKNMKLMKP